MEEKMESRKGEINVKEKTNEKGKRESKKGKLKPI